MFEVHPTNRPPSFHGVDTRDAFHETALREARFTTDYRGLQADGPRPAELLGRLRRAIAGGTATPATEPCGCPA